MLNRAKTVPYGLHKSIPFDILHSTYPLLSRQNRMSFTQKIMSNFKSRINKLIFKINQKFLMRVTYKK